MLTAQGQSSRCWKPFAYVVRIDRPEKVARVFDINDKSQLKGLTQAHSLGTCAGRAETIKDPFLRLEDLRAGILG